MNNLFAKIAALPTDQMIEIARTLGNSQDETTVLDAILTGLQSRLPEPEFIALCDSL